MTAPVVRWMFAQRLAGHSAARITRALNDAGIPCPSAADPGRNPHRTGARWTLRTVAAILANPRYTGRQVWNRQRTDFDLVDPGNTGLGHKQVQRWNLPEGWVISKQPAHPALVSEADFIAARGTTVPRGPAGPAARRYLLAGLLASDPDTASQTQPCYEPISECEIIKRLRRAANDGDLGSDDQSRSMLAGLQPKLLLARFDSNWYLPRGRAHSTHILKPRLPARPDGLAREYYGHALADELGLAHYSTELVGKGARQYLVIERYDRAVDGQKVTLIHQEDAAQALGLNWVDDHAKFQDPSAPRDSHRPSACRIAELLCSLQGEGRPVADFLRRLTFTALLGDNDAHAKNLAILHLPGRSVLADVYNAVPSLFQDGRIDYNLALAIDGSFDRRRISAAHLIREAGTGTRSAPAIRSRSSPRPWPTSPRPLTT